MTIQWAAQTEKSDYREGNADAFYAALHPFQDDSSQEYGLFMVADGAKEGEAALVVETAVSFLVGRLSANWKAEKIGKAISDGFQVANQSLKANFEYSECCLTVAITLKNLVILGHIGNTRAYLLQGQHPSILTHTHDFVHAFLEKRIITIEDFHHPDARSFRLYRFLGLDEYPADIIALTLLKSAHLVLCSRGIYVDRIHEIELDKLRGIVQANSLEIASEQLMARAREESHWDKTVVLARVTPFDS